MTKSLQILFGLVLILVLAYVAFLDVSTKIKDDLLTKTKVMFSENNVRGVSVNMQGEGLTISRSLVLTGTAISEVERLRIETLAKDIEGVCRVDNQIKIYPVVPTVPSVPKVPTVIKVPLVKKIKEPVIEPVIAKSTPKEVEVIKNTNIIKTPMVENTPKEVVVIKDVEKKSVVTKVPLVPVVATKAVMPSVSSPKVPSVPTVETLENNIITVPKAVTAIDAPKVIEVEKIKLEGVK